MSRACCCSVSHANTISPITTIQGGMDAMSRAKNEYHGLPIDHPYYHGYTRTISVLEQVVGEHMRVCVFSDVCICNCVWVDVRMSIMGECEVSCS